MVTELFLNLFLAELSLGYVCSIVYALPVSFNSLSPILLGCEGVKLPLELEDHAQR